MQGQIDTFRDFLRRTDALSVKIGCDIQDLPDQLGFSRASLFAYRSGARPITGKAWRKLEQAERSAGISPPISDQLKSAPSEEEKGRIMESASYAEVFDLLPASAKKLLATGTLKAVNYEILDYLNDAEELAHLVQAHFRDPQDVDRQTLITASKKLIKHYRPTRESWEKIYDTLLINLQTKYSENL